MIAFEKKSAIKMFYYLMSVDGKISSEEMECFNEIGNSMDPENFSSYHDEVIAECEKQMEPIYEDDIMFDLILEGVDDAVFKHQTSVEEGITPVHLIWNLLVMAFKDGEYANAERRLAKHLARVLKVEKSVFLELEQYMKTTAALEKEISLMEQSNRPYVEVKTVIDAAGQRLQVIMQCVEELIQDERYVPIEKLDIPNNVVADGMKTLSDKGSQLFGVTKEILSTSAAPAAKDLGKQAKKAFGSFLKR